MANYFVVEFEDGIQLVSKKWLTSSNEECFLPNYEPVRYNRAVRTHEERREDWGKYPILRIIGSAETYEKGKKKLFRAESRSDVDISTDMNDRMNRRKRAKRCTSNSDEEPEDGHDFLSRYSLPKPPFEKPFQKSFSRDLSHEDTSLHVPQPSQIKESTLYHSTPKHSASPSLRQPSLSEIYQKVNKIEFQNLQILTALNELMKKMDAEGAKSQIMPGEQNTPKYILPNFPLTSEEELKELEENLNDVGFKNVLMNELEKIGGKGLSNIIVRLLNFLLSIELGDKFSYFGTKNKKSFSSLKLCDIITDVVRKFSKVTTKDEIKDVIQTWFRHTKEKLMRQKRRV